MFAVSLASNAFIELHMGMYTNADPHARCSLPIGFAASIDTMPCVLRVFVFVFVFVYFLSVRIYTTYPHVHTNYIEYLALCQ